MNNGTGEMEIKTDSQGNIIASPVTAWRLGLAAESSVLVAIQYVESDADLEAGKFCQVQLVLTPPQCLQLAEALTELARRAQEIPPTKPN